MHQLIGHWRLRLGRPGKRESNWRKITEPSILALQEFFAHHDDSKQVNRRLLHDALNEKFHHKGGLGYLYRLPPGRPIAQGCRLSGLEVPAGSVDQSYGSTS